jgi:hypothetical protein
VRICRSQPTVDHRCSATQEAIRKTAARNGRPVDRITQVSVLASYSYM